MEFERFFNNAKRFVYRNARPLDFARWKFHFEKGGTDEILEILSAYQNPDGGFGHALEPDFWNPTSTPIGVWAAAEILREIAFADSTHPVVQGMLSYLGSGKDFINDKWCFSVPSNNAYPHAVWWRCDAEKGVPSENPTASLAGFALTHAKKNSALYRKARGIAVKSICTFLAERPEDAHVLRCYLELLGDCEQVPEFKFVNLELFRKRLYETINKAICKDTEKWTTEYVCKPSRFFGRSARVVEIVGKELCEQEAEILCRSQLPDGSLPVTWQWWTEYKEAEISLNWWKSALLIEALLFMRAL